MAQGKRKIIVYSDWGATFEKLTDEEAGRLIKHFFSYINDENPQSPDRLTEIAFEPIKQTLKRDLSKWEEKASKNRENGALGGRPSGKNNPKNPDGFLKTQNNPKKPVSVSDSVSDSVSKRRKTFSPPTLDEVKSFFSEKGYADAVAIRAFEYYDTANWHDASGKPVKNWKQKMIAVWFKPENEYKPSPAPLQPRHEDQLYDHVMAHVKKYGQ